MFEGIFIWKRKKYHINIRRNMEDLDKEQGKSQANPLKN